MGEFDLFESLKQGLEECLEHEKGNSSNVKVRRAKIEPVAHYKAQDRHKVKLSQSAIKQCLTTAKDGKKYKIL